MAEETEESAAEIPEYLVAIEESEEEIAEIPEDAIAVIDQEKDFASDYIRTLGERIDDVSSEVEDWAIRDLSTEIDKLHDLWTAKPLEKSILQLLSTVTQHMEQYGPESNPESYGLLQSGYNALQSLAGDTEKNQEILFREMSRVLQWQQDMLIVGRFPTETVGDEAGGVPEEESVGRFQEIMGGDGDDSSMDVAFSTVDLKQEIAALRETLQSEIASLKEALRKE
ncbi:MAG: hypothetical protein JRJ68_10835 [Deltaproteobacteria bacterium]|nr:hypothetical protein [Deltaproteobacteria bacterium]